MFKKQTSSTAIYVAVMVKNILVVALFVYLAIQFNHWWIALFAALMQTSVTTTASPRVICDYCGRTINIKNSDRRDDELSAAGWVKIKRNGDWTDACPSCSEKYSSDVS